MNVAVILLILASVSLSASAQILLKIGMTAGAIQQVISSGESLTTIALIIMTNIYVLLGLFTYITSACLWLFVLAKIDVSLAYPFVGIGFILTMLMGKILLGEPVGATRIGGTLLVVIGITLLARQ